MGMGIRKLKRRHNTREITQTAINNLLWKICMHNAGQLIVPVSEMEQIPDDAALQVTVDPATNNLIVLAGRRPSKSGLWLPPGAQET